MINYYNDINDFNGIRMVVLRIKSIYKNIKKLNKD